MIRTLAALSLSASSLICLVPTPCTSFAPAVTSRSSSIIQRGNDFSTSLDLSKNDDNDDQTKNPLELASWYAVEAFGKAFGSKNSAANGNAPVSSNSIDLTKPPSSLDETLKRIQIDNDRSYFLSGEVDRLIYDEECTFADPFVAFDGRDRFIDNLANLGSFITNYDAKMIKYDVQEEGQEILTKVMVKLELNLPWKPVLAWPWGVSYSVDPDTFLVTVHRESWDIGAMEGVKQIFRKPTVKVSNK